MPILTTHIGLNFEPPIKAGIYSCLNTQVDVSHPQNISVGTATLNLPKGASAVFKLSWNVDEDFDFERSMQAKFSKSDPIYRSLSIINEMLLACKFVRIGHLAGGYIRTVGIGDTLFYFTSKDGKPCAGFNVRSKHGISGLDLVDPFDTTALATPHFNAQNKDVVAKRYVKCFELIEHGYYGESIVIAHAILDDLVQECLRNLLSLRGLHTAKSQDSFMRSIKESRMKIFLGPVLKVLHGKELTEIWNESDDAIGWLNDLRNKISHRGAVGTVETAWKAAFVSTHAAAALHSEGLAQAVLPWAMIREARIMASWVADPPSWVPKENEAETKPFGIDYSN